MNDSTQTALRTAVYRLLRPLVRVMLQHGMAYGSFAELTRKAFVEEGLAQLRRAGKRGTISAVAAMSGLTRKEAARLSDLDVDKGGDSDERYNRAVRVITAWTSDPRFLDEQGLPKALSLHGENSFETLVKEYSGDVPVAAMLSTLDAGGSVRKADGAVHLLDRAYLPTQTPAESLYILGTDAAELIASIDHNLTHPAGERVFQRKVSNTLIPAADLAAFRAYSNQRSQALLEDYHDWLSRHEVDPEDATDAHYVAIGIHYFDSTLEKDATP